MSEELKQIDDTWYRCTVCGREGRVGRCCGNETRLPLNDMAIAENIRAEASKVLTVEQLSDLYKEGQKTVFETVMLKKGGNIGELHMAGIQAIHAALPTESNDYRRGKCDGMNVKMKALQEELLKNRDTIKSLSTQIAEMREALEKIANGNCGWQCTAIAKEALAKLPKAQASEDD